MAILYDKFSSFLEFMNKKQKDSGLTPLHIAALSNNQSRVKELIICNDNIDAQCYDLRETPLHKAVKSGHLSIVKMLLENGANINAQSSFLKTPLYKAVDEGHQEIVQMLLQKGANVHSNCILHYAVLSQNKDIVRDLIQYGIDVNETIKNQDSALHLAAEMGFKEIVQILVDSKANIESKSNTGNATPLITAAAHNNKSIVKILIKKGACVDATDHTGETSLHKAAKSGYQHIVQMLLENGANIDAQCKLLQTPLHKAALSEKEAILIHLIKHGANVNAMSNLDTALHIAAEKGFKGIAQILVDSKADIECRSNPRNVTPLIIAAAHNNLSVVEILIKNGASVNAKDDLFLETALHEAAYHGFANIVEVLLENGANIDEQDINGDTPLCLAAVDGLLVITKMLIRKGANIESGKPLFKAIEANQIKVVEILLNNGADVDGNYFPVHTAGALGRNEILQLLLKHQPNLSKRTYHNNTSQEIALYHKKINSFKILSFYMIDRSPTI